jgi:hypothetical protein
MLTFTLCFRLCHSIFATNFLLPTPPDKASLVLQNKICSSHSTRQGQSCASKQNSLLLANGSTSFFSAVYTLLYSTLILSALLCYFLLCCANLVCLLSSIFVYFLHCHCLLFCVSEFSTTTFL